MSIVIKNSKLNQATIDSINNLIEIEMDAVIGFKLSRVIKEVFSLFEDKTKMEKRILDKWSKKDESGRILNEIEDEEKLLSEMNSFLLLENEIQYDKINFEDLGIKTIRIKDIMELDFLFN